MKPIKHRNNGASEKAQKGIGRARMSETSAGITTHYKYKTLVLSCQDFLLSLYCCHCSLSSPQPFLSVFFLFHSCNIYCCLRTIKKDKERSKMKKVHLFFSSFPALSPESVGAGLGKPDASHEAPLADLQVSLMFQKYTPLAHSRTRMPVLASLDGRGRELRSFS